MTVKTLTVSGLNVAAQVLGGTGLTSSTTNGVTTLSVSGTQASGTSFLNPTAGSYSELYVASNDRSLTLGQRSSTQSGGDLAYLYTATATPMSFWTSATERMRITSAGNVGIGTSSPGQALSVSGNIRSTGEFLTTGMNGLRIGTLMLRNDGSNTYFLYGTSDTVGDNWNTLRPMYIANSTGSIYFGHDIIQNTTSGFLYIKGTLSFDGSTSGYVRLKASAAAGSATYTLPTAVPAGTGYALTSTTGGIMSWVSLTTGTVTSVAALTIGTTGTDVGSSVATGTTTPVITLNIPTASAANRGALSAADWTTFNGKTTLAAVVAATNSWAGTQTFANATYSALFTGGNVGIGTTSPDTLLHVKSTTAWTQPIFESTLTTGGAAVLLKSDYTTWQLAARGSANDTAAGSFSIYDSTANAIRLFINTSGQTGVGRIPSVPLDVEGWGRFVTPGTIGATNYGSTGGLIIRASAGSNDINYLQFVNNAGTSQYYHLLVKSDSVMYTSGSLSVNGTLFVSSLSVGTQGGTIDEYTTGNQALRIYSNTAGKSLWVGFPGGITLNNDTTVTGTFSSSTGTINGLQLTSSVSDNFKLFTKTNTPNPNWTIGYGNGSGAVDTTKEYLSSNAGTISVNSGNLSVTGSTTLGSYLGIGSSSGQIGGARFTVHESSATSLGTAATPNQKIRWTWYNDADGAIVGTRQYQLWVYPYSNQSGSLAIFDSVMAFSIPTYTETALNVSSVVSGTRYVITSLGNTSQSQWNAMAGTSGNTYAVNSWFNGSATGPAATSGTVISFAYTKQALINAPTVLTDSLTVAGTLSALKMSGGAAPRCVIPASGLVPASTNGATLALVSTGSDKYEMQYADGADRLSYATLAVPSNYGGGNITFKVYWYTTTANQSIVWEIFAIAPADGASPNGAPTSVANVTSTTNSAAALKISSLTWSSGLPAAGSLLQIGLRRSSTSSASDTSTETIKVQALIIEFGS